MSLFACVFVPQPPPAMAGKDRLVDLAREFSPRIEVLHDWLVLLDVSGLERLIGMRATTGPATVGFEIGRAALGRGWAARVAVASTRTAALIVAQARPGLTIVPPDEEARVLASLPIEALEAMANGQWPMAKVNQQSAISNQQFLETLRRWGVRTLGELAALPAAAVSARLGPEGPALQRLARGEDPRPLVPVVDPERFEASCDLEWPVEGLEPLSFVLARLLEPLCARLERADRGAAALTVGLTLTTRDTHTRTLQLAAPLRDARALRTLALLDLESHPPAAGVDRVAVAIEPAPGPITQFSLIEHPRPSPEQLSTLLARLAALAGADRVGAPAIADTHRPGAFGMEGFEPGPAEARSGAGRGGPRERRAWRGAGGPADLETNTERTRNEHGTDTETARRGSDQSAIDNQQSAISNVLAPSAQRLAPGVIRRFRVPVVARVAVEGGRPVRVTTGRRDLAGGRIDQWAGPWRASGGWWERSGPWDRDEWDVLAADGVVYRIFQDHTRDDRWFVEGIVD